MEKRQHIRLLPNQNAFAAVRSRSNEAGKIRVGKIKNISPGGLAFEYITDEESTQEPCQVDVFISSEHKFHISKMPCRVVYDIPAGRSQKSDIFFSSFISKQCGIQFERLKEEEVGQLKLFLETYTQSLSGNAGRV